jgi:predicted SnoaL-like aldol condensation-catalyzing enzyme
VAACAAEPEQVSHKTQLEANKQLVLDMWHEVIDGRNIDAARKYISKDYKQNSPVAPDGVEALIDFLHTEFPDSQPLEPGTYPLTEFEFVIAEGDLVQLMFQRTLPSRDNPSEMVDVWWYDTYRVKDGMVVEHWDSMIE